MKNKEIENTNIEKIEDKIDPLKEAIKKFSDKVDGFVYPLIITPLDQINEDVLFDIYKDFRKIGNQNKLHILLYSYGGDAHTAFYIGKILQKKSKKLKIYILREAKSAATLISSSADEIIFSDISELGPMDPQILHKDLERRISPLAIKHTLELLNNEAEKNHSVVVTELVKKLPDPLLLGEYLKSLETGKDYLIKLLSARMFPKKEDAENNKQIAEQLVSGYPDHGYCIDYDEAKKLGLKVSIIKEELVNELSDVMFAYKNLWKLFESYRSKKDIKKAVKILMSIENLRSDIIEHQIKKKNPKSSKK